jgi:hypothetical protein
MRDVAELDSQASGKREQISRVVTASSTNRYRDRTDKCTILDTGKPGLGLTRVTASFALTEDG